MITTAIKHSHLDSAHDDIHRVQNHLRHFQDELLDIEQYFQTDFEIGSMLTFADYFFDGLFVDWMVHGKISDTLEQTTNMAIQVDHMMNRLHQDHNQLQNKLDVARQRKVDLLENAK